MKLATLLLLAASLQAQTGDSFLLCLFVAVVIMCEGAALLWGPRWLKWTITVIAAFITLAMLGVCIAYGQTVKPAKPETVEEVCADIAQMEKDFQRDYPASRLSVSCGQIINIARPTETKIPLTVDEINALDYGRALLDVVSHYESELEKKIIAAHGYKIPTFTDPCWAYVGIPFGTHEIKVESYSPEDVKKGCGSFIPKPSGGKTK